ncbi:MAG: retroviral-like aspartic protease family protein [Timaviella obliquedivisa GSE-PSE-MK23-08B]|jgi:predicted aspartyl protease|nr:retroviral-like aspartic protease family protein [Timaviella obliquedivisa GSE-PSE-MK23-08B]
MSRLHRSVIALLSGSLAVVGACSDRPVVSHLEGDRQTVSASQVQSPVQVAVPPAASSIPVTQPDAYALGLARASSAFNISQSAQSKDDWHLVSERWQQAIQLLSTVPKSSQHYAEAALKLKDYRRNLAFAQQQSDRPTSNNPGIVVKRSSSSRPNLAPPRAIAAATPQAAATPLAPSRATSSRPSNISVASSAAFFAPIVRRAGNTPVIAVTFNGSQIYEMIVDTGASGTLITSGMATALGIRSVGETRVDTASAQGVSFSLGYVDSMEVGGAIAQNVLVAMGGPELTLGLLGHDFFGNYDITIRENEVEFQER